MKTKGKRGHLYFDGDVLCLMVTDGKPAKRSRWETLGGELWMGDISPNAKGTRVQDVKIIGITNPKAAIRLVGIKTIRVMSEAQREVLEKATAMLPRNSNPPSRQGALPSLESITEGREALFPARPGGVSPC